MPVRINLGAGDKYFPSWINCDKHGEQDVQCDAYPLPFPTDYADELWAIHLLEHIHRADAGKALYEWFRVLKRGGKLVLELPSLDKMAKLIVEGEKNMRLTVLGLYGDPRDPQPDMLHKWGWSQAELTDTLQGVNFQEIQFMEPVFHIPERDMRVECRKP